MVIKQRWKPSHSFYKAVSRSTGTPFCMSLPCDLGYVTPSVDNTWKSAWGQR